MLRFGESFDESTGTTNLADIWTSVQTKGTFTNKIMASVGRFGSKGYRVDQWDEARGLALTIDQQLTWIVGFAFKFDANPTSAGVRLVSFYDQGTIQCYLLFNIATLTLSAVRGDGTVLGTSTVALTINAYAYLEVKVKIHASTGTFEVRKDETVILTVTGANTQTSGANQANQIVFAASPTGNVSFGYFDDIYICDSNGLVNKDYLGNVYVEALFPNATGTFSQWGRVDTALTNTQNWQSVDEVPPNDDTDYNVGSAVAQRDTYAFTDPILDTQIYGVVANMYIAKQYAGTRNVTPVIYLSGTAYFGGTVYFGSDYQYTQQVFEYNPNAGTAWTFAAIGSAEFGIQIIQP